MPDTENFIRIRLRDPQQFEDGLWTSEVKKSKPRVQAVMGMLKGTKSNDVQAFLFPREDGWSIIEAQKWTRERVKEQSKKEFEADEIKASALPVMATDGLTIELSEIVLKDATTAIRHKSFQVETKIADREAHEVDIIISSDIVDRDKELVVPAGLIVETAKIPLVAGHGHGDLRKHIGQVIGAAPAGKLVTAKGKYLAGKGNPEADWAWILANEGLGNYSIGFIPKEYEDADLSNDKVRKAVAEGSIPLRKYTKWELVEVSQVIVPSNKLATQRLREGGVIDEKTYEVIVKGMPDDPLPEDQEKNLIKLITEYQEMRKHETEDILQIFNVVGKEGKNVSDEIVLTDEEKKAAIEAALAAKVEKAKAAKPKKDDKNGNGKDDDNGDDDEDELDDEEKAKALREAAQAKAKARKEAEAKAAADLKAKQDAASPVEYLAAGHAERVSTALTHIGKGTEVLANLLALQARTAGPGGGGKQNATAPVNQQHTEVTAAGPSGKPRKDGEEVLEVKGEVSLNADSLKKVLDEFRTNLIKEVHETLSTWQKSLKLESILPAESAAFAKTSDIISAVMTGVKEQIDQKIAKAIADPSAYRRKA